MTVVLPVYNTEGFLDSAISSIVGQTLTNWELLVVDDGSTDRSLDIAMGWQARDARISVHRSPANGGAARARNIGVGYTTGEFIALMDADDVSLPARLERQVAYLSENPDVGAVGTAARLIDAAGEGAAVKSYPTGAAELAWSMFFGNCVFHPTLMVRSAVLRSVGGYEPAFEGAEDYRLLMRIASRTRIANIDEPLLLYRRWGGNVTSRAWTTQELHATEIARAEISALIGEPIGTDDAAGLRGLATETYPRDPERCARLGGLVGRMASAFNAQEWLTPAGRSLVARNAGVKLWLLTALAMTKSPRVGAELSAAAMRLSPGSLTDFLGKSSRVLWGRR